MATKFKRKYLVDASAVTPPLPPNEPRLYERWAVSEAQACQFVGRHLKDKLKRFIHFGQLEATEDTSVAPIPTGRLTTRRDEQDHSCHPHLLQLPLFEESSR